MIFTSFAYAGFLAVVVAVNWLLPRRFRPALLLVSSYVFYASWSLSATVILAAVTLVVYGAGLRIPTLQGRSRVVVTGVAVALSASSLVILKTVEALGLSGGTSESFAVPVGLSFFSFQAISYLIDVHREDVEASRSLPDVALYLAFFPHLLAGPIVRARKLIPAFHNVDQRPDPVRSTEAAELLLVGTFKKVVVADPILVVAGSILARPTDASAIELLLALVATLVAAYFDVTGYIDIARGSAKLLGIDMQRNSLLPLTRSTTYADFWRRWQLTIMAWFRDYIYRPVRGDGKDQRRDYLALLVTFFLLGIWHGLTAGWALWGLASGAIITAERARQSARAARRRAQRAEARRLRDRSALPRDPSPIAGLAITVALVVSTLPLIVTSSMERTGQIYAGMVSLRGGPVSADLLWYLAAAIATLVIVDRREERREARAGRRDRITPARAVAFGVFVLAIIVSSGPTPQTFIYFAF